MYKKCLLWLLSSVAVAQVPTLRGKEVTGQPQLSALLYWTTVPNATYSVYRSNQGYNSHHCPASTNDTWIEIASGLSVTNYIDTPTELGAWCYAVTATVSETESALSNSVDVVLGNHWYVYLHYRMPDCRGRLRMRPIASLTFTQVLNNITTSLPVGRVHPNEFTGIVRLYDNAQYSMQITLSDGKVFNIPNPIFGTGQPLSAAKSSSLSAGFREDTNEWCDYAQYNYYQPATNN